MSPSVQQIGQITVTSCNRSRVKRFGQEPVDFVGGWVMGNYFSSSKIIIWLKEISGYQLEHETFC